MQRSAIASTGAAIDGAEHGALVVTATPAEIAAMRKLGYTRHGAAGGRLAARRAAR